MKTDLVVLEASQPQSEAIVSRRLLCSIQWFQCVWTRPWIGWVFVYTMVLLFCFIYRCASLTALISMYGGEEDCKFSVEIAVLSLGFLEDLVCATYLAFVLWLIDTFQQRFTDTTKSDKLKHVTQLIFVFTSSWILFMCCVGPVAADLLLARLRGARFTFQLLTTNEEHSAIDAMTSEEMDQVYVTATITVIASGFFAIVRTFTPWSKLSEWDPTQPIVPVVIARLERAGSKIRTVSTKSNKCDRDENDDDMEEIMLELQESSRNSGTNSPGNLSYCDLVEDASSSRADDRKRNELLRQRGIHVAIVFLALVIVPLVVVGVSKACSALVAYSALNATLNELCAHALGDTSQSVVSVDTDGSTWVETYIHSATENYMLFQDDSLYRRTTSFKGDLAFDVNITDQDQPNVLLIVVESFRFHDLHYLVGDDDPSNLFKGTNITITPNFDKWAKRGVAFTNFLSSWRTSRSVESLQYAQIPYDSVENSGMTGGKKDVELAGLSQLFKAKGYEPFITTGCQTEYDDWNSFLPAHGFDTVWSRDEMMKIAESDLNISSEDWYGEAQRGLYWSVHDDLSFQILGDLLINKTQEQSNRVAQREDKKPLFLTHYAISSHIPFQERPKWYADADKPDFSALYEGEEYADLIKNYLEMRYFTDVELGRFMDRMSEEGILNDTIVIISGDHGQAPEFGYDTPEVRELSATRVAGALIAEGRLGKYVGLKLEDAAEQYDILNTLADITGVPEEGFLQDGVGRSLKRKVTFGERVVFSNNPSRKMLVVRGNKRLQYDRHSNEVLLHDSRMDHDMKNDQFSDLSAEEQDEWLTWRNNGRWLNTYYTTRWDQKCLLPDGCDVSA